MSVCVYVNTHTRTQYNVSYRTRYMQSELFPNYWFLKKLNFFIHDQLTWTTYSNLYV